MRGLTDFESDELVTVGGQDWRFQHLVPPEKPRSDESLDLQFIDVRARRRRNWTPDEFLQLYASGKVQFHRTPERPGDEIGDDELPSRALMRRWRLYWTSTYDQAPVPKSTKKLAAFIIQHSGGQPDPIDPPSPHTLRRWLRERGSDGDRRPRQMGNRQPSKGRRRPVHSFVQATYEAASAQYWSNYKVTNQDVVTEVRAAVIQENTRRSNEGLPPLKVPGKTTIWRWLRQERSYKNVVARDGRHTADRMFKGIRNSLQAKRIMDVAILDHKRMDVHIVDPTRRMVIGRPWLAALIDVKSRMLLGFWLTFEDPSVLSAMACIRSAVRGMPDLKQQYPKIDGEWEAFGVPRTILVDNAWENTGSSLVDACADNGISIEWAPVRRPEHKGILERFFKRMDDQLAHKLPGAVIDNPTALARRRIDPRADAGLTLAELRGLLCAYFVDVYANDVHDGINDIPLRVWREAAERDGIELAHDLAAVEHAMGKLVRDRRINHEGVTFLGLTYRSAEVDGLLADLLPLQPASVRTGTAAVKIKYHPEDLSRIFVWNEVRNRYVPLPCTDAQYADGLSERIHEELRKGHHQRVAEFSSEEERCIQKAELQKAIQESYEKAPAKQRRRRARLSETCVEPTLDRNISIDALSSRVGGDNPEKAPVRSRCRKTKGSPDSSGREPQELAAFFDPFSGRDREAAIARSLAKRS